MMDRIPGLRRFVRVRRSAREDAKRSVDEELRFHLEMRARELEAGGLDAEEARAKAVQEFGDVARARRLLMGPAAGLERSSRRRQWRDELRQDVRYGWRQLLARPSFSVIAIVTLAVGIGAAVAIFSVVNGVLLRPLPWAEPERLVIVWENDRVSGTVREPASVPDFYDFRDRNRVFADIGMFTSVEQNLTEGGAEPVRVKVAAVSAQIMTILGVTPLFGRAFEPGEDRPGGPRVVMLTASFWRDRFGGERTVLSRSVMLDDSLYTIVGVLPAGVEFPDAATHVWIPAQLGPTSIPRATHPVTLLARLRPGIELSTAQADMTRIASELEEEYPQSNTARGAFVEPLEEVVFGSIRPALYVLLGAAGLLLVIACANVASLLLARGMARGREVAVRATLGAGGARLTRQFVVESLLLSLVAALAGVVIARLGLNGLLAMLPADLPRAREVGVDGTVLGLAVVIAAAVGIVFGLVPAWQARRVDLQGALKSESDRSGTPGRSRQVARSTLVVMEVAISVMLVVAAGLLVRTVSALRDVDPGFRAEGVLRMEFQLPVSRYPRDFATFPDWPRTHALYAAFQTELEQAPGVESFGLAAHHPLNPGFTNSFLIIGREDEYGTQPEIYVRAVSPGYFPTLEVELLDGRLLSEDDRTEAPNAAVINEAALRRFFPDGRAVGRQLQWWGITREIVGVVGNERFRGLSVETPPAVYVPLAQAPMNSGSLLVRTSGSPRAAAAGVRAAVRAADPELAVFDIATLDETITRSIARERSTMLLLGVFATVALFLALIGVHGVLGYAVAQRRRELGVRLAIGAKRADLLRMVLGQGMRLAVLGVLIGLAGALAGSRLLATLLFGVTTTDLLTFVVAPAFIVLVAGFASWLPARHATSIDPAIALRTD
ncbi:MAG: ABC transporter permease [Gemmatimonadetes bacterium]|nr:ABC transporter permease [Gemmatimonadota bacterium]